MCLVIQASCVLANVFAKGRKSITIKDLNEIRTRLEEQIPELYVDISSSAIINAVEQRPDMFSWYDDDIERTEDADEKLFSLEYVDRNFNWRIPADYRKTVEDAIKKAVAQV